MQQCLHNSVQGNCIATFLIVFNLRDEVLCANAFICVANASYFLCCFSTRVNLSNIRSSEELQLSLQGTRSDTASIRVHISWINLISTVPETMPVISVSCWTCAHVCVCILHSIASCEGLAVVNASSWSVVDTLHVLYSCTDTWLIDEWLYTNNILWQWAWIW